MLQKSEKTLSQLTYNNYTIHSTAEHLKNIYHAPTWIGFGKMFLQHFWTKQELKIQRLVCICLHHE